jgi:hypothetical protein
MKRTSLRNGKSWRNKTKEKCGSYKRFDPYAVEKAVTREIESIDLPVAQHP